MDFIERWLHISPDGGSGWLEAAYLLLAGAIPFVFLHRRIWESLRHRWESCPGEAAPKVLDEKSGA